MSATGAPALSLGDSFHRTPSTLLVRARALCPDAWGRLVALYGPLVYRWCRQAGLQEADAADAGQEVFRAVAGSLAGFRRDRPGDSFRKWLRTIARHKVADVFRRPPGGQGVGGSDALDALAEVPGADLPGESAAADADDELELYRRAVGLILAEFGADAREAFLRVVVGRREPAAVAEELGMSLNAVYLAKARVKRRLRDEFADLLEM